MPNESIAERVSREIMALSDYGAVETREVVVIAKQAISTLEVAIAAKDARNGQMEVHRSKGPFIHLVWSSADSALFLEVYDKDGKTLAGFELNVPSTQESVLSILRAMGQEIPPRERFTAPPRPELVLVRFGGHLHWAQKKETDGWFVIDGLLQKHGVELCDPTIGEPIGGE